MEIPSAESDTKMKPAIVHLGIGLILFLALVTLLSSPGLGWAPLCSHFGTQVSGEAPETPYILTAERREQGTK